MKARKECARQMRFAWFVLVEGVLGLIIVVYGILKMKPQLWYDFYWLIPLIICLSAITTGVIFIKLASPKYWG